MRDKLTDTELNDAINRPQVCWVPSDIEVARRGLRELQSRRAAEREQAAPEFERVFTTYSDAWHRLAETDSASAPQAEAAPEPRKPDFVGVDMASEPDRTETCVIRLRKRPRWLRELLGDWERRACDLVAQGRAFDAEDLRAGAEEVRMAHNRRPRKPAKWLRQLAKMTASLRHNAESGEWEVWWEPTHSDVMDTVDFGKTPQEAVKAAWRARKEERGE